MKSRPSKQKLKQRGILRERVFGCDLGEHLLNSAQDVPQVLRSCTDFIEKYGIVDGIYRLSGIASNIQKLRHEFDSEQIPDLTKDVYIQDIHCVGSLCKLYFRELPNPLLTYQLYEKFSDAVSAATDEERLVKIHDVIQQLPPPHYRTLEFLMRHLSRLATYCSVTNMHTKNLAIVWAPNLLRSKQIESACFSGTAAFMEVRIQSVVVEFILNHVEVLFSPKLSSVIREGAGHTSLSRPKSLLVSSPSTKLLSLEEAQARTQAQINSPVVADSKYIEVGEGPAALQGRFHTVIDFPAERKRPPPKIKKSPVGSWRSFFSLGKPSLSSSSISKRKLTRNPSEPTEMKAMAMAGGRGDTGTMRSAKSEESLTSLQAAEVDPKLFRPRRPRSSSDALSASYNGDLLEGVPRYNSYDNLPQDQDSFGDEGLIHVPGLLASRSHDDEDLSPPEIGVASLDFDPMSFQCSPPRLESEGPESRHNQHQLQQHLFLMDAKEKIQIGAQTPNSGNSSEPMSPFQERLISPFLTPDRSPKLPKAPSFAEKMVQALSPKLGRKAPRAPPVTISEPVAVTLPSRVSEMVSGLQMVGDGVQGFTWRRDPGSFPTSNLEDLGLAQLSISTTTAASPGTIDSVVTSQWNSWEAEAAEAYRAAATTKASPRTVDSVVTSQWNPWEAEAEAFRAAATTKASPRTVDTVVTSQWNPWEAEAEAYQAAATTKASPRTVDTVVTSQWNPWEAEAEAYQAAVTTKASPGTVDSVVTSQWNPWEAEGEAYQGPSTTNASMGTVDSVVTSQWNPWDAEADASQAPSSTKASSGTVDTVVSSQWNPWETEAYMAPSTTKASPGTIDSVVTSQWNTLEAEAEAYRAPSTTKVSPGTIDSVVTSQWNNWEAEAAEAYRAQSTTKASAGTVDTVVPSQWNSWEVEAAEAYRVPTDSAHVISSSSLTYLDSSFQEFNPGNVAGSCQKEEEEDAPASEKNKTVSATSTPPGSQVTESPQDGTPVNSVSLIPPPPPPKNAARILALALAESAQQAAYQKRPHYLQFTDLPLPPPPEEEPPPPDLPLELPSPPPPASPEMAAALLAEETPSYTFSITTIHCSPVRSLQPLPGATASAITPGMSPSSQAPGPPPLEEDAPLPGPTEVIPTFPTEAFTPPPLPPPPAPPTSEKPSPRPHFHQRSESFPSHMAQSSTPPAPPVRTLESRLATALHSNYNDTITASNYHSFLSTMMLPSSLEDALPRHNYPAHVKAGEVTEQGATYRHPYPPPPPPPQAKTEDKPEMGNAYRPQYPHGKPESHEFGYRHPYPSQLELENVGEVYDAFLHHKQSAIPKTYRADTLHLQPYSSRCETSSSSTNLYGTYKHPALQHNRTRNRPDYMGSLSTGLRSYSEEVPPYPTIRRVQSMHVPMQPPPPPVRTVPISRTEVPPDDEPAYCPRPVYQYKACPPYTSTASSSPSSADYHVTQLQPYFENGRVHYRYSPYSGSTAYFSSDGTFYDMDPYTTLRFRQFPLYPSRDFASYTTRHQPKAAYRSQGLVPYPRGALREHNFISRDVPPALPQDHPRPLRISWDMEDMDRYRLQSLKRENRARQRSKGPVMSQYDNVAPSMAEDMQTVDIIHLRSRSDPGKAPGLLSVAESKDNRYPGRTEGEERLAPPPPAYGNSHQEKPSLPHKQSGATRNRSQQDFNPEHRTLPKQEAGKRLASDTRNGPPFPNVEYASKSMTLPSDHASHPSYNSQEPVRLNHKEEKERTPRDCYREDPAAPPRPSERSHSLRGHNPETLDKDPALFYPYQTLQSKLHSSIAALSQYDNVGDYHSIPHHRPAASQPTQNAFPLPNSRTYATALGQGAFLAAELSMQRAEAAKVHAE